MINCVCFFPQPTTTTTASLSLQPTHHLSRAYDTALANYKPCWKTKCRYLGKKRIGRRKGEEGERGREGGGGGGKGERREGGGGRKGERRRKRGKGRGGVRREKGSESNANKK